MKQIPDEIKAGMALLDEKAPGWREKIDLDSLDMSFCFTCVLGQVFGEYIYGLKQLGIADSEEVYSEFDPETNEKAQNLGFQSKACRGITLDYDYLNKAWKQALSETSSPSAA